MTGAGDADSVIFTGSGSTAAVELLIHLLQAENLCLSIWDYASGAPYMEINVNGHYPLDAIFFSGHKFIGGVSSPGVLVVKKSLIHTLLPKRIGGGTVFYVSTSGEWYLKDSEYREEGGTSDSVGIIRLALAVKLKRAIGDAIISAEEERISRLFANRIRSNQNLVLLGTKVVRQRLSVFSFVIKDQASGLLFHHNYIAALLNDLFGIQSRAGCMCAGPYAQYLLGIDAELAAEFLLALRESNELDRTHLRRIGEYSQQELLRPGFVRVSIPFFWTDNQVNDLIDCIQFVSERASDFIHLYQLNCESGEWHHQKQRIFHARKWLGHVSFTDKGMEIEDMKRNNSSLIPPASLLVEANQLATESKLKMMKMVKRDENIDTNYIWNIAEEVKINKCVSVPSFVQGGNSDKRFEDCYDINLPESAQVTECPLYLNFQGGNQSDQVQENGTQELDNTENWNKRVIVRRSELSSEEEMRLPWHNPPLELYRRMADAIHGLNMIKVGKSIYIRNIYIYMYFLHCCFPKWEFEHNEGSLHNKMLAQQELVFPDLFNSLRAAIKPLILVDSARTDEMRVKAIENICNSYKGKLK
uniref:Aminotran_5 domain-containing protein n=1 Tax=Heterorhabditis bacteriophora TaxID=37862 RepID=A0A1I7XH01_HETBA